MAIQNANSLTARQQNKPQTFSAFLTSDAIKAKVNSIVGGKRGDRFISAVVSAVSVNPALGACDHSTILSAALLGEGLNLSPSPQLGQYYLVPFNDRKNNRTVATFQLGYKGYIQLAIRSGYYKKLNVLPLKKGELVRYDPLEETIEVNLMEDELERETAETTGYYAMFEYQNGFRKVMYWSKEKMLAHADTYSKAFSADAYKKLQAGEIPERDAWKYSSFWYKDFDGMACKTMLRQLISKWGIMSIDMQKAFDGDMALIHDDGSAEYVDNDETADVVYSVGDVVDVTESAPVLSDDAATEADPTAGFFG